MFNVYCILDIGVYILMLVDNLGMRAADSKFMLGIHSVIIQVMVDQKFNNKSDY